jgi:ribosomal protein L40E
VREGQLEFYRPIQIDGRRRSFRFEWPGGAEIQALSFQIQRPAKASGFRVSPTPTREWDGENGLRYALVELGSRSPSDRPSIEIEYEKETDALTAPASTSAPSRARVEPQRPPDEPFPAWLAVVIGLGGGALLFFLIHAAMRNRGAPTPVAKPRKKGAKPLFCHECGAEGERTDSFCRKCGTRLLTP